MWVSVSSLDDIRSHLPEGQRGRLRLADGKTVRVAHSPGGGIFEFLPGSRKYGHRHYRWPPHWGTTARLELPTPAGVRQLQPLAAAARCVARYAPPGVWPELQEEARAALAYLDELARLASREGWQACRKALQALGVRHLAETRGVTTLRSQSCPEHVLQDIQDRFSRREAIEAFWQGKYDCSVLARPADEHGYWPSLATEYRGLGNGHYWALVDGFHAVHLETD
ncbi:MAG: hypothetical protein RMK67_02430 [Chloroflexota bacterium]|nr:hypothetical protein [Chloroflexota bacterium]